MTFVCFAFPLYLLLHCVVDIRGEQCFDYCKFSNKRCSNKSRVTNYSSGEHEQLITNKG